jgi:hypothetical protein
MNSSGMSLLTRQNERAQDLLAMRRIEAAGEATEIAAQVAEESVSRRAGW